jgi:hypothetical protein
MQEQLPETSTTIGMICLSPMLTPLNKVPGN